ncbi:ATP-binding cassette domain-containing protein [Flavivirga jejuensis]|uniref:ABC transporter ATP-binding protein n=1 Tax=Flavivirga jejuensis TaxID=870487 RepID=A0ABT8WMG1_9FLAO|nr:ABC transporter ATP-binding protein [Flavivirga jejuensis]MDO5974339.1 ABC transporter ATP-binding protein [Flavivirga jejuensis]
MIYINDLVFNYDKQKSLFNNLSLELESGQIVGLFGKNGSGKSTFLKLISGLINPRSGVVKLNGDNPFKRLPSLMEDVYLVSEDLYIPDISIKKYIDAYAFFYKKFDLEKMHKIMKDFALQETDYLHKISYGQKKKFLIAFALSTNCQFLLLDEPTNGIDITSKSIFRKVLINSITDHQMVIISTHQVRDIETIIDRILILDDGNNVFNYHVNDISEHLKFERLADISNKKNIVFYEKELGAYKVISPVDNSEETDIDLELLFNAIISKAQIKL